MTAAEVKPEAPVQEEQIQIPSTLPVLPLRDVVTFPYMLVPLVISSSKSIAAVDQALAEGRMIFLATQSNQQPEDPAFADMYEIGTVGMVIHMLKMPDRKVRVLVQGIIRAKVQSWGSDVPCLQAKIDVLEETQPEITGVPLEALMRNVNAALEKAATLGKNISQELLVIASNLDDAGRLADLAASNLSLKIEDAQDVL